MSKQQPANSELPPKQVTDTAGQGECCVRIPDPLGEVEQHRYKTKLRALFTSTVNIYSYYSTRALALKLITPTLMKIKH